MKCGVVYSGEMFYEVQTQAIVQFHQFSFHDVYSSLDERISKYVYPCP